MASDCISPSSDDFKTASGWSAAAGAGAGAGIGTGVGTAVTAGRAGAVVGAGAADIACASAGAAVAAGAAAAGTAGGRGWAGAFVGAGARDGAAIAGAGAGWAGAGAAGWSLYDSGTPDCTSRPVTSATISPISATATADAAIRTPRSHLKPTPTGSGGAEIANERVVWTSGSCLRAATVSLSDSSS